MTDAAHISPQQPPPHIAVEQLTIGYDDVVVLSDISFEVARGDVFVIMGGSGSGKSTLLRHMIGLAEPLSGAIHYGSLTLTGAHPADRHSILRSIGVLFQSSALWSAMTLEDNVALPIEQLTRVPRREARALARFKLALVGLAGFEHHFPSQISGGMQKRAGLARAIALDPATLFLDEPSAGLDPITGRRLDELILELRDTIGVSVVVVTHELASIFAIGSNGIFLDGETHSIIGRGNPRTLRDTSADPRIRSFLNREAA